MKIFLGLSEIAGFFARLKIGFEGLDHAVDFVDISNHPFAYGGSKPPDERLKRLFYWEGKRRSLKTRVNKALQTPWFFLDPKFWVYYAVYTLLAPVNILQFIRYFKGYDCVIFMGGISFTSSELVAFNDLFWLRFLGIKIIALMTGSDSRPAFVDHAIISILKEVTAEALITHTLQTQGKNEFIETYADFIISNPFSSYFFTKPIIPIQTLGHAALIDESQPTPAVTSGKITILHAPSAKDVKGTATIQKVIEELQAAGYAIDFRLLSGVPNEQVIQEIKNCDFIVDQLYSDYPMASFATEAAGYRKPAVVGSYISAEEYARASPVLGVPPACICQPKELGTAIIRLIQDEAYRLQLGEAAYHYAAAVLHPKQVALRYVALIEGTYPTDWLVDPQSFVKAIPLGMPYEKMLQYMELVAEQDVPLSESIQRLLYR